MRKIRKGDKIVVVHGKDRGKTGEVVRVLPKKTRAIVSGVNLITKNVRPRRAGEKGQQVQVAAPVDISNLKLICSSCKQGVRSGWKYDKNNRKVRVCRKCGKAL